MVPTKEEMLSKATSFTVLERDRRTGRPEISIVLRDRNPTRWAISLDGMGVLTRDLEDVYEPSPSNRTDEFIQNTRFSLEEAWELAEKFIEKEDLRNPEWRLNFSKTEKLQ